MTTDVSDQLGAARATVDSAEELLGASAAAIAAWSSEDGKIDVGLMDRHQIVCYDLAYLASAVDGAKRMLDTYAGGGEVEADLTVGYTADVIAELRARFDGRAEAFGVDAGLYDKTVGSESVDAFVAAGRSPEFIEKVYAETAVEPVPGGPAHLSEEFEMLAETFKAFAGDKIAPQAEEIHRSNGDIPEDIISGVAELGLFGLTIPEAYGGFASEDLDHTMAMVVATEMLTAASLGAGGGLITRPEILSKALVGFGTEVQKQDWLPKIASGEKMVGVAVTEPDFGSDVASLKVRARPTGDGSGYIVNGVKTWCTFAGRADYLMLLARTGEPEDAHRGLSLFVVPKTPAPGHEFVETQSGAHGDAQMEGRAIDTIGYRGLHSFEVSFDNWFVPAENLVGEADGLNKGFYMQMNAFSNGRVQTAGRAVGIMQAAYEQAVAYAKERKVFGHAVADYQLTKAKLARIAWTIQACRQYTYQVAELLSAGEGQKEASMVKMYACRASEWVTREAMQIHGGMGYAEEYDVSRYFVDARVLTIFEGAEETLALRVIVRRLLEDALAG